MSLQHEQTWQMGPLEVVHEGRALFRVGIPSYTSRNSARTPLSGWYMSR